MMQTLNGTSGLNSVRGRDLFSHVHHRTSYRRTRCRRPLSRCFEHNQSSRDAEEAAHVYGCGGQCLCNRDKCGTATWRSVHAAQYLEVVLLDVCPMK